jgi:anti-sigma factor RsiW
MAWFRRETHPEEQLSAYVDGELDARARRGVEIHVTACEACSALLDELRETKSMLAALPRQAPARSFALGLEYDRTRQPEPRRSSFTFAPVAALTVLVALLFVDAADFSTSSSENDAGSLASEAPTAGRQAESAQDSAGAAGATPQTFQVPQATGAAAEAAPDQGPTAAQAGAPDPTPIARAAAGQDVDEEKSQDDQFFLPDGAPQPEVEAGSDGISTLRVLQIVAALALVVSLGVVYLPRFLHN